MSRQEAEEKAYSLVTRGVGQQTKILLVADALLDSFAAGRTAETKLFAARDRALNQALDQGDQD